MTIIDPATNLVEIAPLLSSSPTAKEAAESVEDTWLARYPRPLKCNTDNGPEFAHDFEGQVRDDWDVARAGSSEIRNGRRRQSDLVLIVSGPMARRVNLCLT